MVRKPQRYEVRDPGKRETWTTAEKAAPVDRGFLHYELRDGTIGLARPGTWRLKGS